ncbi:MAG: hypothetical protein MUQ65_12075 [Armatimonadetes bacterium]|nr:hypothetical protein [Armatimonadota bacterium]
MQRVVLLCGILLWVPGFLGAGASLVFGWVIRSTYAGPLAWLGVVALAMSYVVPFALVLSAIGLAWSTWQALSPGAAALTDRLVTAFMVGVLLCCLHIGLFLGWAGHER